jgi:N-acyl-D-aspartate/D-glutamate deacylase
MKRRTFLKTASTFGALASFSGIRLIQPELKVVLRGGKSFYQNQWQVVDVGIDLAGRLKIGPANSLSGVEVVRTDGKIISPGFIDILADNAANPLKSYGIFEKYKVSDGVTTALQMHGGSADTANYYKAFGALPHYINYGVSTAVMQVRYGTADLVARRKRVEKCLEEGALGVSHSIEYQPTPYDEVLVYAKLAKKYDRPFFLHLRYSSSEKELDGVEEAVRIARDSGAQVHIDHLHSTGGTFHMAEALNKIEQANASGLRMTCCVYPYSFWATYLHSKRFDEGWQQRYGLTYNDLRLVGTGERLTAQSFQHYKALKKLVAVPEGTLPLDRTVDLALKKDFCMIGSDGGIEYEPHANSHPRGAGCFSTSLRHCMDIGMPLERILEKMITLPRSLVLSAMKDRGVLADGAWADLTVFDPASVNGKATVTNPNQFSSGIEMVFVNGKVAYQNNALKELNGTGIRNKYS